MRHTAACGLNLFWPQPHREPRAVSSQGQGRVGHDNSRQRSTRNPPDSPRCQHNAKDARHTRCRMQQKRTPTTRGSDDRKVNYGNHRKNTGSARGKPDANSQATKQQLQQLTTYTTAHLAIQRTTLASHDLPPTEATAPEVTRNHEGDRYKHTAGATTRRWYFRMHNQKHRVQPPQQSGSAAPPTQAAPSPTIQPPSTIEY